MTHDEMDSSLPQGGGVTVCVTLGGTCRNPGDRSGQGGTCPIQRACGHDGASLGGEVGQGGEASLT